MHILKVRESNRGQHRGQWNHVQVLPAVNKCNTFHPRPRYVQLMKAMCEIIIKWECCNIGKCIGGGIIYRQISQWKSTGWMWESMYAWDWGYLGQMYGMWPVRLASVLQKSRYRTLNCEGMLNRNWRPIISPVTFFIAKCPPPQYSFVRRRPVQSRFDQNLGLNGVC